jgi:hypothetical protein
MKPLLFHEFSYLLFERRLLKGKEPAISKNQDAGSVICRTNTDNLIGGPPT